MKKEDLVLYAITDRSWLKENQTLAQVVEEAILGGVTMIQFREKHLSGAQLRGLACSVQEVCRKYQIPFLINDDVLLAKEIGADGVHVGQSDMAVREARALLGPEKIVGATAKTIEQAQRAQEEGADYLGSGAIFGTTTKADAKPMTRELLDAICESVSIPVVAIGGIDETNIEKLRGSRIAGTAVISGIFAKANVRRAAENLMEIWQGKKILHCITNSVTMHEVANIILAVGASPIMAHHKMEVEEVEDFSDALLVNLGATDDYEAMELAYRRAISLQHPIVIDPVGVGGIAFRRQFLQQLLAIGTPTCIRGNMGEIRAIWENHSTMRGLDYDETDLAGSNEVCPHGSQSNEPHIIDVNLQKNSSQDAGLKNAEIVAALAKQLSCIIVASGKTDILSDGKETILVETGSSWQKRITGSGCMLSAVIAAKFCQLSAPKLQVAAAACLLMGETARIAEQKMQAFKQGDGVPAGMMSFYQDWMNQI